MSASQVGQQYRLAYSSNREGGYTQNMSSSDDVIPCTDTPPAPKSLCQCAYMQSLIELS